MKTIKFFLTLIAFMAITFCAFSQNDDPSFYIIETMKSKPGMTGEYVDAEMKVWKKLHQERMKQGKIVEWYFYEVRYPSGTSTAYDFVTVTGVKGWAGLGAFYEGWDFSALTKSLTKEEVAIVNKTEMMRDLTTVASHVIIGGGITGLLAAHVLAQRKDGRSVMVIESADNVGGLLRSFDYGEFGHFDHGTHIMAETGETQLDKLLFAD